MESSCKSRLHFSTKSRFRIPFLQPHQETSPDHQPKIDYETTAKAFRASSIQARKHWQTWWIGQTRFEFAPDYQTQTISANWDIYENVGWSLINDADCIRADSWSPFDSFKFWIVQARQWRDGVCTENALWDWPTRHQWKTGQYDCWIAAGRFHVNTKSHWSSYDSLNKHWNIHQVTRRHRSSRWSQAPHVR